MSPYGMVTTTLDNFVEQSVGFLDLWMRIYDDSLKKVNPEIASARASRAISALPEELKAEIKLRSMPFIKVPEAPNAG